MSQEPLHDRPQELLRPLQENPSGTTKGQVRQAVTIRQHRDHEKARASHNGPQKDLGGQKGNTIYNGGGLRRIIRNHMNKYKMMRSR